METILYLITGLVLGFIVGSIVAILFKEKEKQRHLTELKNEMEQRLTEAKQLAREEMERYDAERDQYQQEQMRLQQENHRNMVTLMRENHEQDMQRQQERFDATINHLKAEMKSVTEEMLKQRQKEFSESSHANLGQIVTPLRETIDRMKQVMQDSTLKQTAMSSEMRANIEMMMKQSRAAQQSADELTRVFKHGSKVQGDWGETVLDELLQSQGLTRGIHYDTQAVLRDAQGQTVRSDDGSLLRPDVILHLDQRREVIIDSKVSMTAYIDYVNEEDEGKKERLLREHIESMKKHVRELSTKDYSSYVKAPKVRMDYVIMFVPHSGALWTALNAQPDLWRRAMDRNVFIADEQTLFAALRIINLTWTQIVQQQNHEKVYALANEMLDRVGLFMRKYQGIGEALEKAQKAYEEAGKKLEPQGQSIIQTCRKLVKLGARQSEKNPLPQLIDVDDIPSLEEVSKAETKPSDTTGSQDMTENLNGSTIPQPNL
ncbi:MAG: DNA recombination protein RmuC [Bacteroidaceae bacterium]|nr:DNA recombination protein RmuC [Bacteroidaceae bacterium]